MIKYKVIPPGDDYVTHDDQLIEVYIADEVAKLARRGLPLAKYFDNQNPKITSVAGTKIKPLIAELEQIAGEKKKEK